MKILNHSDEVIFESEFKTIKEVIVAAVECGADLKGADLKGADLEGAYLEGANLEWANLKGANLKGANLEGADLEGANLEGANLEWANLKGANLKGADLEWADLEWADLKGADLKGADLEGVDLKGADLEWVDLEIPVIEDIHRGVLACCEVEGALDMSTWHKEGFCGTTHCQAGWVVHLAGEAGRNLEEKTSTSTAAYLIYRKSDTSGYPLNFYATNKEALDNMRRLAEREGAE